MFNYQNVASNITTPVHMPEPSWTVDSKHNQNSMTHYIDSLFSRYARLLVVRIDLHFQDESRGRFDPYYCKDHMQRLLNNRRCNSLFNTLVGYAWCMECGEERGLHYHCLFIFDGSRSQQDITLGDAIGKYWSEVITGGEGTYYCSNRDKAVLEAMGVCGIGRVDRNDWAKRALLDSAASYLMKDDPQIRLMLPNDAGRYRTFGRGEMR